MEIALNTLRPPLDRSMNAAVMTLANKLNPCGWDVVQGYDAPSDLESLTYRIERDGRIAVSGDHSDMTAYGDAEVNSAFRAWHDWTHWKHQLPFTLEGETAVAWVQIGHLRQAGLWTPFRQAFILAEVVGQATHYDRHGTFPEDQWAFTLTGLGHAGFSHNDLGQPLAPMWRNLGRASHA